MEMIPQMKARSCLPSRTPVQCFQPSAGLSSAPPSSPSDPAHPKPELSLNAPLRLFPTLPHFWREADVTGPIQVWAGKPPGTGPAQRELGPARVFSNGWKLVLGTPRRGWREASGYGPKWEDLWLRSWAEPRQGHRIPPGEERGPEAVSWGLGDAHRKLPRPSPVLGSPLPLRPPSLPLLLEQPSGNAVASYFQGSSHPSCPFRPPVRPWSACHCLIPRSGVPLVPCPPPPLQPSHPPPEVTLLKLRLLTAPLCRRPPVTSYCRWDEAPRWPSGPRASTTACPSKGPHMSSWLLPLWPPSGAPDPLCAVAPCLCRP